MSVSLRQPIGLLALFILSISCQIASGQTWILQTGPQYTDYKFINSTGLSLDDLKSSPGQFLQIGFQKSLLDTTTLMSKATNRAVYFSSRPKLSKLLTYFAFGIDGNFNQFNTVGDARQVNFAYQADYAGIAGNMSARIPILKTFSFQIQGKIQGLKLIHGTQTIGSQHINLITDNQFNGTQIMGGYSLSIHKHIDKSVGVFMQYNHMQSLNENKANNTLLTFNASTYSIGISLTPKQQ